MVITLLCSTLTMPAALAVDLDAGPVYVPPGAGTETFTGDATRAGGATIDYTGIDLSQTANLYFGIRNDMFLNGFSMDGGGISGAEIFRFDASTANTIVYTGQTTFHTGFPDIGTWTTPTRFTLTFTGAGTMVSDADTIALNGPNGDVHALWRVESSDFSVALLIEAVAPPFDANGGNYEPGNDLFNRIPSDFSTGTSFDWAFYYEEPDAPDSDGDGVVDSADNCLEVANADQLDTNGDGFGNLCDGDFTNDCAINFLDLNYFRGVIFGSDADADMNGDGMVNFGDLVLLQGSFFGAPGPSGLPTACD